MTLRLKDRMLADRYIALGGNLAIAARASGITTRAAQIALKKAVVREYLDQRVRILSEAGSTSANEVMSLLVSHLRADVADILPDVEIVQRARKAGVSHLIRRIKVKRKTHPDGSIEEDVDLMMVDSQKALKQLCRIMGLDDPFRDDELERTRTALLATMKLKEIGAEEAIMLLTPHFPAAPRLKDEFIGKPIVDLPAPSTKSLQQPNASGDYP